MKATPNTIDTDLRHMQAALSLARRGLGNVWPNPAVGCILVRPDLNDRVVGRGWTQPGGRPHAETEALARAGELARGATAYVTLEPCSHTGQTGPCSQALIDAGVARAVVAAIDPDTRVSGAGIAQLREAGVAVEEGVCAPDAQDLNAGFRLYIQRQRPFVALKLATTLDGRIASRTGHSQWITGGPARQWGHLLRARHDAIATGIGTVLADDPQLTCRIDGMADRSPVRVVLDSQGRMPAESQLARTAGSVPTWRYTTEAAPGGLAELGIEETVIDADADGRVAVTGVLADLAAKGITRLMVEAGPEVAASFLRSGTVDALYWFRAPKIMGGDGRPAAHGIGVEELADMTAFTHEKTIFPGDDTLEIYRRRREA